MARSSLDSASSRARECHPGWQKGAETVPTQEPDRTHQSNSAASGAVGATVSLVKAVADHPLRRHQ